MPPQKRVSEPVLLPSAKVAALARVSQMTLNSLKSLGDFPEPPYRGWYRETDVLEWLENRRKGLPLPSGRILQAWSEETAALGITIDLRSICKLARCSDQTLRQWIRRGDFPPAIPKSKGQWSRPEVDKWLADRNKGVPLTYSGTIPASWRAPVEGGHYSSRELLALAKLGTGQIYDLMRRGDFPPQIRGQKGHWKRSEVNAWVEARKRGERLESGKLLKQWETEYYIARPQSISVALLGRQFADMHWNRLTDEQRAATDIITWREGYPAYLARNGTQLELDEYNGAMRLNQSPQAQVKPQQASKQAIICPDDDNDSEFTERPEAITDPSHSDYGRPDDNDPGDPEDYGLDDL